MVASMGDVATPELTAAPRGRPDCGQPRDHYRQHRRDYGDKQTWQACTIKSALSRKPKSGPYKDMGSSHAATAEERATSSPWWTMSMNSLLMQWPGGRHRDTSEIKPLADGRVSPRQAMELGLVDRLGDFHDAILLAAELAGIEGEPAVVDMGPKNFYLRF